MILHKKKIYYLDIKDDDVYKMFIKCGDILGVRIVRDSVTGIGKGFGYVNFKVRIILTFIKINLIL